MSSKVPPAFDPRKTYQICSRWTEPVLQDPQAQSWFKAASTLHAKSFRTTTTNYQNMLILYEAAAKRGHWMAAYNLGLLYGMGGYAMADHFPPEDKKARYWQNYGLAKDWAPFYYLTSMNYEFGRAGYTENQDLSLAYLQAATEKGSHHGQRRMAYIYGTLELLKIEERLLKCAIEQGNSYAAYDFAATLEVRAEIGKKTLPQAINLTQQAIMLGGSEKGGGSAAHTLLSAFKGIKQYSNLKLPIDLERSKAYAEIEFALMGDSTRSGNPFLKFPRLNEVLPLPPAKMPPWQGIYSAMSKEDAAYYQNPPDINVLLEEVRQANLYPADLSQPVLYQDRGKKSQ